MPEKDEGHTLDIEQYVNAWPTACWLFRLPIIRHIRAGIHWYRMDIHYERWTRFGLLPAYRDFDEAVIQAIWRGEK